MVEETVRRRAADPISSKVARVALPVMGATPAMGLIDLMMFLVMVFSVLDMGAPIMPGVATGISMDTTGAITAISEVTISIDVRLILMFGGMICLEMDRILLVSMMPKNA
jgi:hypothetical protein